MVLLHVIISSHTFFTIINQVDNVPACIPAIQLAHACMQSLYIINNIIY